MFVFEVVRWIQTEDAVCIEMPFKGGFLCLCGVVHYSADGKAVIRNPRYFRLLLSDKLD